MLRNAMGVGVSAFPEKRYEGVMFNVISVMRGWVGVKFPGSYVTLEWPLMLECLLCHNLNNYLFLCHIKTIKSIIDGCATDLPVTG